MSAVGTSMTADLIVLGGGPAGISAALAAAELGVDVCLVDAATQLGGQIWRQPQSAALPPSVASSRSAVPAPLQAARSHPRIEVLTSMSAWHARPREGGGAVVHLDGRALEARAVVLATGASELSLPFPGWDLPGVVTPGAAQALLKAHGIPIGRRAVVAGTGPFLWPVAAGLIRAGTRVAALVEAAPARQAITLAPRLAGHPGLAAQAGGYVRTVVGARTPVLSGCAVVAAHGTDAITSVTVRHRNGGRIREIAVDALCVGWGFVPAVEIARQLGCAEIGRPHAAVVVNAEQATSVPGIFAAGEVTGIGGAVLAAAEGEIAGLSAARWLGAAAPAQLSRQARRRRRSARRAAQALVRAFPLPEGWTGWLTDETVVCRCEEVTWRQVADAIDAGITDARGIKGQTRCGMGWCQGRVCGPAVVAAAAERSGRRSDGDLATRPLAVPVTIATLMSTEVDT